MCCTHNLSRAYADNLTSSTLRYLVGTCEVNRLRDTVFHLRSWLVLRCIVHAILSRRDSLVSECLAMLTQRREAGDAGTEHSSSTHVHNNVFTGPAAFVSSLDNRRQRTSYHRSLSSATGNLSTQGSTTDNLTDCTECAQRKCCRVEQATGDNRGSSASFTQVSLFRYTAHQVSFVSRLLPVVVPIRLRTRVIQAVSLCLVQALRIRLANLLELLLTHREVLVFVAGHYVANSRGQGVGIAVLECVPGVVVAVLGRLLQVPVHAIFQASVELLSLSLVAQVGRHHALQLGFCTVHHIAAPGRGLSE
ncbi:hypothetical protein KAONASHI_00470 [Serratia phage vB_SmaP-Kaonashi]|nr:hypothetical protein KAONASHI_00470 [Serratia phage vB_SmaP-Kaonashi]